jgi:RNA polymerase sigma-70 factor (ECF subfamily)
MADVGAGVRRESLVAALKQVARGDQRALEDVYMATCAKLFGVCLRICQDREAAEDILQQVYVKVWDRAGRFDPDRASPITWLCAIARNTALDWRRANQAPAHLPESAAEAIADASPLAWEAIAAEQESARIVACLDGLDERARRAIHAAFYDGFTYLQLAQAMAVPLGTMKSWIRRALLQLRGCLGHD